MQTHTRQTHVTFQPEEEGSKPVRWGVCTYQLGSVRAVIRGCVTSSGLNYNVKKSKRKIRGLEK
jgi:hypothetical protein